MDRANARTSAKYRVIRCTQPMPKKSLISEEERALFKDAVKNVTPLAANNKIPTHKKPKPPHRKIQSDNVTDILLDMQPLTHTETVGAEAFLQFVRPGLQTRVIQRLRRGEFTVAAVLDLHGLNLAEAQKMLVHFIAHALEKHWRCVQIIHGKGARSGQPTPLLKNAVNNWLRTYTAVLAFCSCKVSDGGTGAVYVLLKSP